MSHPSTLSGTEIVKVAVDACGFAPMPAGLIALWSSAGRGRLQIGVSARLGGFGHVP
jgi:hypothetical protein